MSSFLARSASAVVATTAASLVITFGLSGAARADAVPPGVADAVTSQVAEASSIVDAPAVAANDAVDISSDGTVSAPTADGMLTLTTPASAGAESASDDASTVFEGEASDTQVVVQTLENGGVRAAVTIASAEAPEEYSFDFGSAATALTLNSDETVTVLDADSEPLAIVDAPWALDASGRNVPTHYEVHGTTLTQVIQHRGGAYDYGIVADPSIWWWIGTTAACVAEVATLAAGGAKVVAAFAKSEAIIKASSAALAAYNKLGSSMSKLVGYIKTYATRGNLTATQVSALGSLFSAVGSTLFQILGLGSCWNLVQELR